MNKNPSKTDTFDKITQRIIELLERGYIPWKRPWNIKNGPPANLFTRKPYKGVNVFLLSCTRFSSPYFLTENQAQRMGGNVKKGAEEFLIFFWKFPGTAEKKKKDGKGSRVYLSGPLLFGYSVYNVEECEGIPVPGIETKEFDPIKEAEDIVSKFPDLPEIETGGDRASYSSIDDLIRMPAKESFFSPEEYYGTLFHEIVHSTGHIRRLNRPGFKEHPAFVSEEYSKEELIAELGSAFLCGNAGIEQKTIRNSAAYIKGWINSLNNDKRLLFFASASAQRAVNYITGEAQKPKTVNKNIKTKARLAQNLTEKRYAYR
ncbi:MAG: DUF1738 domain-containing protein [Candidatus Schekmanbacteria bacterium]|nr:DUF1738 domain-containing protein [Candidatus Schekmanbacteria bacterium]